MSTWESIAWDVEQERRYEARRVECVSCGESGHPEYAERVLSRVFNNGEHAVKVWACLDCIEQCSVCGERYIKDEMRLEKLSCEWECEPCQLKRYIENDLYFLVPAHKAQLALWKGEKANAA